MRRRAELHEALVIIEKEDKIMKRRLNVGTGRKNRRNVITRSKLRGKPLLDMCKDRQDIICYHEYGENDNRQFCRGFIDKMTDEYLPECRHCGAWVHNAEPLEDSTITTETIEKMTRLAKGSTSWFTELNVEDST